MKKPYTSLPWEWSGRKVDKDGDIHIPQGSYFGETTIVLSYDAEGSERDCDFAAEAVNMYFDLVGALTDIVNDIENGSTEWETNGTLAYAKRVLEGVSK